MYSLRNTFRVLYLRIFLNLEIENKLRTCELSMNKLVEKVMCENWKAVNIRLIWGERTFIVLNHAETSLESWPAYTKRQVISNWIVADCALNNYLILTFKKKEIRFLNRYYLKKITLSFQLLNLLKKFILYLNQLLVYKHGVFATFNCHNSYSSFNNIRSFRH